MTTKSNDTSAFKDIGIISLGMLFLVVVVASLFSLYYYSDKNQDASDLDALAFNPDGTKVLLTFYDSEDTNATPAMILYCDGVFRFADGGSLEDDRVKKIIPLIYPCNEQEQTTE